MRGFVDKYHEIQSRDPKNRFGKKIKTNKTNQDLICSLIYRMVKHDMLRTLRDYGMNPDYDENCKEWSNRTINLWKLLTLEDAGEKDIDASQSATFTELRNDLPRPLQPMLDLGALVGSGSMKISLLPFVGICVYNMLNKTTKGSGVLLIHGR